MKYKLAFLTEFVVVVLDQLTKRLVTSFLAEGSSISVFPFLSITNFHNTGISFGLLKGRVPPFLIGSLSIFVLLFLFFYVVRAGLKPVQNIAVGLVSGGILGNLIDRIYPGAVIDFLDFHFWPVFNIADSAITVGIFLILFYSLRG